MEQGYILVLMWRMIIKHSAKGKLMGLSISWMRDKLQWFWEGLDKKRMANLTNYRVNISETMNGFDYNLISIYSSQLDIYYVL